MKSLPVRTPFALVGLVLTVGGAGLLPLTMIGLLGIPLTLIGLVFCATTALGTANRDILAWRRIAGVVIGIVGVILLGFGCLLTSLSVAEYYLAAERGVPRSVTTSEEWMTLFTWIVSPVLIALGTHLRSSTSGRFPLAWAAYWFMYFPLVILAGILCAALGLSSGN